MLVIVTQVMLMDEEQDKKNKKKRGRRTRKVVTVKIKSQNGVFILEFLLLHIIVNFYKK
jgi:hypothetical protein